LVWTTGFDKTTEEQHNVSATLGGFVGYTQEMIDKEWERQRHTLLDRCPVNTIEWGWHWVDAAGRRL
jgi:hypothetical protein